MGMPAYAILRSSDEPKVTIAPIAQKKGNERSLLAWLATVANAARRANVAVGAPSGKRRLKKSGGADASANGMIALL